MYAVVRTYSGQGASELFELLGQREEEVKALISGMRTVEASGFGWEDFHTTGRSP